MIKVDLITQAVKSNYKMPNSSLCGYNDVRILAKGAMTAKQRANRNNK